MGSPISTIMAVGLRRVRRHLFSTLFVMNPFGKISGDVNQGANSTYNYDSSEDNSRSQRAASTPGSEFLLRDGSVKFLKDTINAWPYNPVGGKPTNVNLNTSTGTWSVNPPGGVYQALSTRNGGEIISADSY